MISIDEFNRRGAGKLPGHLGMIVTAVDASRIRAELPIVATTLQIRRRNLIIEPISRLSFARGLSFPPKDGNYQFHQKSGRAYFGAIQSRSP